MDEVTKMLEKRITMLEDKVSKLEIDAISKDTRLKLHEIQGHKS